MNRLSFFLSVFAFSAFVVISAGFLLFIFLLAEDDSRKPPPSKAELELMAHDVYAVIAGNTYRVPLVAIYGVRNSRYLCSEKDNIRCVVSKEKVLTNQPIEFKHLNVSLENYSDYFDGDLYYYEYPEICPRLSREWARQICTENHHLGFFGLQRFSLVEKKSLTSFDSEWINGYERIGSLGKLIQKMNFDSEIPSTYCGYDKQGIPLSLCAAGMQITDNLLAAWVVTREGTEIPMIAKDGKIIRALLMYGMGETENFKELNYALSALQSN